MTDIKRTVFFGPFVGEFGWELLFWHGWVKRLCRERYKDYRKIACSLPGRYPFYPEVDEFWPLPEEFLKTPFSSRNYIADCWQNGLPKADAKGNLTDVWPRLEKIIKDFKKELPPNAELIHPWQYRYDQEDKRYYGVDENFKALGIPYSKQILERLKPSEKGRGALSKIISPEQKLITIFPRKRVFRRPDKNWQKENYEKLIKFIQQDLPGCQVAILGEPGGAFFEEAVPAGCVDLINIDPFLRMDIQLAALNQSIFAIGSQSGAMTFAMAAGAPSLVWGEPGWEKGFSKENYTGSKLLFLPSSNPSADLVFKYAKWLATKGRMPSENPARVLKIAFYRIFNLRHLRFIRSKL